MDLTLPPKVTDRAFLRLKEIGAAKKSKVLRIAVEGGGCSGFQYEIALDEINSDDWVAEKNGEKVVRPVLVVVSVLLSLRILFG